ncbi:hypothetical protein AB0F17_42920 [Nonomuraea sp. NPDC026600]|uniref:hypothetical protein n=1 Tax=Nonomuraea sp. NPDC026600 TaxID=3155363 RepID=UPI003410426D
MARTKARIYPGLAKRLAAGVIRDKVERITEAVAEEAKDRAPDAKRWQTTNGADARPSHRHADGQIIPASVPYQLPKMEYVRKGGDDRRRSGTGPGRWVTLAAVDLADRPRDPSLPLHQRIHCECQSVIVPGVIAAATRALPATVRGSKVSAMVEVVFPRIGEAEFGTNDTPGSHFLSLAGSLVMARRR